MTTFERIVTCNDLYEIIQQVWHDLNGEKTLHEILDSRLNAGTSIEAGNCADGTKDFIDAIPALDYDDEVTIRFIIDNARCGVYRAQGEYIVTAFVAAVLDRPSAIEGLFTCGCCGEHHGSEDNDGYCDDCTVYECPECGECHACSQNDYPEYGEFCSDTCYCGSMWEAEQSAIRDYLARDVNEQLESIGIVEPDCESVLSDVWQNHDLHPESYYQGMYEGWEVNLACEAVAIAIVGELIDDADYIEHETDTRVMEAIAEWYKCRVYWQRLRLAVAPTWGNHIGASKYWHHPTGYAAIVYKTARTQARLAARDAMEAAKEYIEDVQESVDRDEWLKDDAERRWEMAQRNEHAVSVEVDDDDDGYRTYFLHVETDHPTETMFARVYKLGSSYAVCTPISTEHTGATFETIDDAIAYCRRLTRNMCGQAVIDWNRKQPRGYGSPAYRAIVRTRRR